MAKIQKVPTSRFPKKVPSGTKKIVATPTNARKDRSGMGYGKNTTAVVCNNVPLGR